MGGRNPLPTQVKQIKGTLQPCRTNYHEPVPEGLLVEPPDYMPEGAKAAWRYALECAPPTLIRKLDMSVLEIWACAADLYRQAQAGIGKTGLLVKAPHSGVPMQSPYLAIANQQAQIMTQAALEMGFTPASRSRISIPNERPGEELDLWEDIVGCPKGAQDEHICRERQTICRARCLPRDPDLRVGPESLQTPTR